jgi:hypothetical protein
MAKLKIQPHVVDKVLNHTISKLRRTYNTFEYRDEREKALNVWAKHVESLVGTTPSNVVTISKAG